MTYADIVLPLPLNGFFTYAVPPSLQHSVAWGMRVLVPFGNNKFYVGIVVRLYDQKPEGYAVKEIAGMLRLPVNTVKTRLARARNLLKNEWEENPND